MYRTQQQQARPTGYRNGVVQPQMTEDQYLDKYTKYDSDCRGCSTCSSEYLRGQSEYKAYLRSFSVARIPYKGGSILFTLAEAAERLTKLEGTSPFKIGIPRDFSEEFALEIGYRALTPTYQPNKARGVVANMRKEDYAKFATIIMNPNVRDSKLKIPVIGMKKFLVVEFAETFRITDTRHCFIEFAYTRPAQSSDESDWNGW